MLEQNQGNKALELYAIDLIFQVIFVEHVILLHF